MWQESECKNEWHNSVWVSNNVHGWVTESAVWIYVWASAKSLQLMNKQFFDESIPRVKKPYSALGVSNGWFRCF